jgi:Family of unknown function (DUF6328)
MKSDIDHEESEELPLSRAAEYLLEECRMVLPGIQALFGFQLIAVFNQGFGEKLTIGEERLHLVAIKPGRGGHRTYHDACGTAPADRPPESERDVYPGV